MSGNLDTLGLSGDRITREIERISQTGATK